MSAPNVTQANDQGDARALPIPKSIGELIPVAWTSSHSFYLDNRMTFAVGATEDGTRQAIKPLVFFGSSPRSIVYEILNLNLTNPFKPVSLMWNHVAGADGGLVAPFNSPSATSHQAYWPLGIDIYADRYKYFKLIKATFHVEIEHYGGWEGDKVMPLEFGAWRVNNDLADFPDTTGDGITKWRILQDVPSVGNNSTDQPHIWRQMQMHPKFQTINGGQPIGPAHSYGFGTADATMIHTYPHMTSFGYVYTPTDNAEDPSSTAVTTHWTAISNGTPGTPSQVQLLRIFATNHLNSYESNGAVGATPPYPNALSAILNIRIRYNCEVQWRDRKNIDYSTYTNA